MGKKKQGKQGKGNSNGNGGGGGCRGKTKKGGVCPNPAEFGGFCQHHQNQKNQKNQKKNKGFEENSPQKGGNENFVKKQNYFPSPVNPVQRQFQEQLAALSKMQERHQRLSEFMMKYGISGGSRIEIVKVLGDLPLSYLRRMVSENGLGVDLNQNDKIQIAVDIVTCVELPEQGNSVFSGLRLQQTIVKDQFYKCADKFKANIAQINRDLQKLIVSSALNWCSFNSSNGHLPLINRIHMEGIWINSLALMFSGFEMIFKVECNQTSIPNMFEVTVWLTNFISRSEWESFFTYTLTECKEALMKSSSMMESISSKRKKDNVDNELGFGWNLF
jgi:hypothetical protein